MGNVVKLGPPQKSRRKTPQARLRAPGAFQDRITDSRPRARWTHSRASTWIWLPILALIGVLAVESYSSGPAFSLGGLENLPIISATGRGAGRENSIGEHKNLPLCSGFFKQNCVIDGDTIRYDGMKIRLADIDTPETYEPGCPSEAALGKRATLRMQELINEGPFIVADTGGRDEDKYGRKLRMITRNGRSLGDILIAEGLARPWGGARRSWCG